MKTREIDCWYSSDHKEIYGLFGKSEAMPGNCVKAKLILPAEPEVVEFESEARVIRMPDKPSFIIQLRADENNENERLSGRRWKCKFEEVL